MIEFAPNGLVVSGIECGWERPDYTVECEIVFDLVSWVRSQLVESRRNVRYIYIGSTIHRFALISATSTRFTIRYLHPAYQNKVGSFRGAKVREFTKIEKAVIQRIDAASQVELDY
jgi:hypothetical protein